VNAYRVHDLLQIDPAVAGQWSDAPSWVGCALERAPWVVVRRTVAPNGIAVGVRGSGRGRRYAAVIAPQDVRDVRVPEDLIARADGAGRLGWAFGACSTGARAHGLTVAPIGAYGFALASGSPATHARSDLDLLLRAETFALESLRAFAAACASVTSRFGVAIDVELAFGANGLALAEVLAGGAAVVAKTPHGPKFVACLK
jgi:phosphoribosyl-dephospho-CoA transferase